jgi:amino acid transporter
METQNRKQISLFSAIAISVTAMVGSGWLFSAQLNAQQAGNYAFLSWILAAFIVILVGLCLADIVAKYPLRGVTTRSSALSHNNIFGMPFAFANWFGLMVVVGTEAQATTQYFSAWLKSDLFMNDDRLTVIGKLLALSLLILYVIVNYYGIKFLSKVNNTITTIKIFAPIFTVVLFLTAHFDTSNFHLATNTQYSFTSTFAAIIGAGLIYSYNGFQLVMSYASEIKNPRRNVPLTLILSTIVVMLLYLLLQLAFMGAIPHDILVQKGGWANLHFGSPLMNLSILLGLNFLAVLLIADSVISPSGTGYSYLGGSARMLYGMSAEGQMPRWIMSKLHKKYNICRRTLIINFILTAIIMWNAKSWSSLMVVVTGYHIIGYLAAPISLGAIRTEKRLFGLFVFIILSYLLFTFPNDDFLIMNLSLNIIMFVFALTKLANKTINSSTLLKLNLPFLIYLWLIYTSQLLHNMFSSMTFLFVVSTIFYLFITHKKYIAFCKKFDNDRILVDEDKSMLQDSH